MISGFSATTLSFAAGLPKGSRGVSDEEKAFSSLTSRKFPSVVVPLATENCLDSEGVCVLFPKGKNKKQPREAINDQETQFSFNTGTD